MWVDIRTEALSVDEVTAKVALPSAGGIDVFIGAVRDENERIAKEIEAEIPGVTVAAAHRIGSLAVGDMAVVCAASAKHRGEAFQACKMLIDRIKHRVPIWKREHGPDGAYWVGWVDARCHDHGP